jgi:hypothetical protein
MLKHTLRCFVAAAGSDFKVVFRAIWESRAGDLTPGSFVGVYCHGEITREMLNLLAEMWQMGYVLLATDANKQDWTQIEIPRFRVVGE